MKHVVTIAIDKQIAVMEWYRLQSNKSQMLISCPVGWINHHTKEVTYEEPMTITFDDYAEALLFERQFGGTA